MTGDQNSRELRSFGRRRGRKASERQAALLRDVLPRVALDLSAPSGRLPTGRSDVANTPAAPSGRLPTGESEGVNTPAAPSGRLPTGESEGANTPAAPSGRLPTGESEGANPIWLEIGFGGGEHLVWQAERNPSVTLIGCEPFEDGVMKVLDAIASRPLANLRVHMGDARDVLRWLPDASIARAFILFPDPWPKRKHQKRRLVNRATLALLARVMKPGAELRFGTDIGDYARSALEAFRAEPRFVWQATRPADWRVRPADWPETRYEAKAEREGRRRYYFRFHRV